MIKLTSIVRRRWPLVVICAVVGITAGIVSATLAPKSESQVYTAEQIVLATGVGSAQDALTVTRGEIPAAAAKILGTDQDPDDLAAMIVVTYNQSTESLTFASNDTDGKAASKRVAAFVQAFLDATNKRLQSPDLEKQAALQKEIDSNAADLASFDAANPQFKQPGFIPGTDLVTTELLAQRRALLQKEADLKADLQAVNDSLAKSALYTTLGPEKPKPAATGLIGVPSSKSVRATIGGLLGLLLGAIVAMIIERLGRRIDTREELAEITDLPVLTEIGWLPERRRGADSDGRVALTGVWAEPYRRLRSAVHFVQSRPASRTAVDGSDDRPSVFLVTSSSPGEGKSTTSALLALALAESGTPTVLVGADFRKPRVDGLIGLAPSPSIQDFARLDLDRPTIDDIVQQTHVRDLYGVAPGPGTREVARLIDATIELCEGAVSRGATVVVDSSPVKAANDTIDLLPAVDYVILVVRAGVSTEKEFLDTVAYLHRLDAKILGIVLIGTRAARRRAYYYYDYYTPPPTEDDHVSP